MSARLHAPRNRWILLGIMLSLAGLSFAGWRSLQTIGWIHHHATSAQQPLPALQGSAATEYLKQQGLYSSLSEAMTATRYGVHTVPGPSNQFHADNPSQQYQASFSPEGVEVRAAGDAWRVGLKLRSVGYGEQQMAVGAGQVSATANRTEYDRPVANGGQQLALKEWFVNKPEGLEQGFTLAERPRKVDQTSGGSLSPSPLRLTLAVESEFRPQAQADGNAVELVRANGERVLRYEHLVAFDARGKKLAARMNAVGSELRLEVEDADAVYPVTIDPTFVQQAYLKASNTEVFDAFGSSLAVSGDTVVIGASHEASNATGVNGDQSNNSALLAGAAYVFVRSGTTWSQQAYLKASNTDGGDLFGRSVAVSGDTIVVGAIGEASSATGVNGDQANNSADRSGAAYIFVRSGTTWSQQAYLKASNTDTKDAFGISVAASGDTVMVGAHGEASNATGVNGNQMNNLASQSGAAYVFVRSGTTWSQQAYLKASNTNDGDFFGVSVAMSGNTAVVGAYSEASNATGINGDQTNNSAPQSGAAYVFVRSGTTWSQQAYLKPSNTEAYDDFGVSVAVSGDTVVVGAPYESSNATGVNGDQTNNSAPGSGATYVFVRSGATWSQQAYLKASNTGPGDGFGVSVAMSDNMVVVGAGGEDSNATGVNGDQTNNSAQSSGAAYVFVRSGAIWSQQAYLKASNTQASDDFVIVAVSGDTVVVGALSEDSSATGVNGDQSNNSAPLSGAAYVFVLTPNTAPTISPIGRAQIAGGPATNSQIATVSDVDQAANTLTVNVNGGASATVNGVTVSGISVNAAGQVTANIVAAANATTANFTLRVTDSVGAFAEATLTVTVVNFSGSVSDPLVCTGPGNTVGATLVLGNPNGAPLSVSNTTTFTNLVGVPNSCTVTPNVGTCAVTNANLTYTATLAANQTVTITYLTQVADNVTAGTQVCTNNAASFGGGAPVNLQICGTVNCSVIGPGLPFNAASPMNDQRAGSVLIYNVYTSATDPTRQNTRLNITNTDPGRRVNVHLFFIDGASCSVADSFLCLTPNQTTSFLASDLDPGTTGYVVAIATDASGCPINFNFLIGDEYVKFASGHAANLGTQAVTALAGGLPFCDQNASTATLSFDGISYAMVPRVLALDNVPARADGNDTLLIVNRIGGNLATGASTLGTLFGIFYNDTENSQSFSVSGTCQLRNSLSNNFPRTTPRFEQFIPAGRSGWLKLYSQSDFGLTGATINFNADAGTNANAFNQGHNLHILTLTTAAGYTIPVFPAGC